MGSLAAQQYSKLLPDPPLQKLPKLSLLAKLVAFLCDCFEASIVFIFGKQISPFLNGNFAPVSEFGPKSNLPVIGNLPACLNGEFVRIGPNPKFKPVGGYHWFDGDGMLHGLRIKNGNATYVSRYVKTARLLQEEHYGGAKFVKLGDMKGFRGIISGMLSNLRLRFGVLDASNGTGTGNTALVYHNRRLMALHEGDMPYVIRILEDGNLETVGRLDYDKKLAHPFTAHPKVDPVTGEMFFFGYQMDSPLATYRVVSKDGVIQKPVPITLSEAVMMHDFAITENYAIFMDLPLVMRKENLAQGKFLFTFDSTRSARFGVLPRYAVNEHAIHWFELPSCYVFHTANAWEEGEEVVLYACRTPEINLDLDVTMLERTKGEYRNELYEFRFNLKNGAASQKQLSESFVEFPRINDSYLGRKQRYVYASVFAQNTIHIEGVVKFDLEKKGKDGFVSGKYAYGSGRYGSEAVFVPNSDAKDEDDGYLIAFVYDETLKKSEVIVIDAKTMAPDPVAVISVPVRVPYGFHAIFVNEEQLMSTG